MTDDGDGDIHDYDAKLYVGGLEVASAGERVPPELLAVFTDQMHRTRAAAGAAHPPQIEPDGIVYQFASPGPVIADRLDVLGFTPLRVLQTIGRALDEAQDLADLVHQYMPDEAMPAHEAERSLLTGLTAAEWIAQLGAHITGSAPESHRPGGAGWLMALIKDVDRRTALRAALLACPQGEVCLDVTHLQAMGALATVGKLCSSGLSELRAAASAHAPIVVLAEGKTDIEFLEPALQLLYPHLVDLIRFMDFGQRPQGSAGTLVATVKAFTAAGVANRVVALFDNDTAAADALRPWDRSRLPASIRVYQYPPLDLAADYPTLGPPPASSRAANADVNGLAGSIELYLGRDVLTSAAGRLRPVHWRSYIEGMRQYQGEVVEKDAIHDAYRAKVRAARADPSRIADQDWSGIQAILDLVIRAFS
jgi:hypothetical protein